MSIKINGLDDLQKHLGHIEKEVSKLEHGISVSFDELFTEQFMLEHSNFSTFDELLQAGGFVVNSEEEFEAIPDSVFDEHISMNTDFDSWEDMLSSAQEDYVVELLDF